MFGLLTRKAEMVQVYPENVGLNLEIVNQWDQWYHGTWTLNI